jgi:hypothetical protein
MARLHLDQNVSAIIAQALRREHHDVLTTNEAGLLDADDDLHLLVAAKAGRILLTHNGADFQLLHRAWHRWARAWQVQPVHGGILVIPQAPHWAIERAVVEVDRISQLPLSNQLYLFDWRPARGWVHEPPPVR